MIGAYLTKAPQNWQVVQQGYPIVLEGTCQGGAVYLKLLCELTGKTVMDWTKTQQTGTNWHMTLEGILPGIYTIVTCLREGDEDCELARQGDKRFHVGVGDVFVIAGQSNAVGFGREEYQEPPVYGVHIRRNNGCWDIATHPFGDSTGFFGVNRDKKNPGHCPYLTFGRILKETLHYPIGFLETALGGSSMALWNPKEDGDLYRNMVNIIKESGKIKGVLWYQGCAEAMSRRVKDYEMRFLAMRNQLAEDLGMEELPFLTCQVNQYDKDIGNNDESWDMLRRIQEKIAREQKGVSIVHTLGLATTDGIHNSVQSNKKIGELLAEVALRQWYGRGEGK